jgi:hypothetical protein
LAAIAIEQSSSQLGTCLTIKSLITCIASDDV